MRSGRQLQSWLLAFAVALPLAPPGARGEDWPTWQHDAARTGRTNERATVRVFPEMPQAAWKFSFPERVHFRMQPIVVKGIIFVGCMDGKMYSFDGRSGELRWTFEADGEITNAPTVAQGLVLFGTIGGSLFGINAEDGRQVWRQSLGAPLMSSPAVEKGRGFIGSFDGHLYAFDVPTGRIVWKLPTDNKIVQSPAVKEGRVFVGSEDLHAYCADAATGKLLWKSHVGGVTLKWGFPVVAGETVIFTTVEPGGGFAGGYKGGRYEKESNTPKDETRFFDVRSGQRRFEGLKIASWYYNMIPPVVKDEDTVWLPEAHLFELDLRSGQISDRGRHSTRGDERPTITIGGDDLLYGVMDQNIFTYDVKQKKVERELWGTPYLHRKPPDFPRGDNMLRYSTGTGGGGAGCGSALVMSGGMGYTIIYSWLYAFKLGD